MVSLSPRFATLAALCSIAALSAVAPSANAAAIDLRRGVADLHAERDGVPTIPLPPFSAGVESGSTPRESHGNNERRFIGSHPMFGLSDLWTGARRDAPSEPGLLVAGSDNSVAVGDRVWRSASDGGVVLVGDNQQLDAREPHDHHHHHYVNYQGENDAVLVSGDNNRVNIHSREPHSHHHHHHENYVGETDTVVVSGNNDRVNIHSRSVLISGEEGVSYVVKPSKRFVAQERFEIPVAKRSTPEGVPGTIDIMSPTDNESAGQRIASLLLATANNTSSMDNSNPSTMSVPGGNNYVLNASPNSGTKVLLVPVPPVATETASSTSTDSEIRVTLQIPVFDAESASTQMWCATFDAAPPAPAPLTAEACVSSLSQSNDDAHKSQIFAYNPSTGAVRPMWYDGQDDGTDSSDESSSSSSDNLDPETPSDASIASVTDISVPVRRDEEQAIFATPSASMSTSASTSASSSSSTSVSASTMSASTSSMTSTSSTSSAPMTTASSSSGVESMSTSSSPATDVMLMFIPAEPEVMEVAAPEPEFDQPASSSSMSQETTSTTSSSAAMTTDSASSSSMSMTTTSYAPSSTTMSASSSMDPLAAMDFSETSSVSASSTSSSVSASSTTSSVSASSTSSSVSASSTSSSSMAPVAAMDFSDTSSMPASSTTSSMSASSTSLSVTTSASTTSTSTSISSSSSASATHSMYGALDVQIVAEAPSSSSESSMSSSASSSMSSSSSSATTTTTTTTTMASESAASPSMTPVSTAPYTWMFKRDS